MNLSNYCWWFQNAIPERICDEIVKYGKSISDQMAVTGGYGDGKKLNQKQVKDLKKKRNSNIVWLNDRWIYKEIHPYVQNAIPERICDEIVKYGKSISDQMAVTGGYGDGKKLNQKQVKDLKKKRNSNIVWLNDRWIYKEIHPYVHQANVSAGWNFNWDWSESCQFTKYEKGQFYDCIVIVTGKQY